MNKTDLIYEELKATRVQMHERFNVLEEKSNKVDEALSQRLVKLEKPYNFVVTLSIVMLKIITVTSLTAGAVFAIGRLIP